MLTSPSPQNTDMFHVFVRSISGELVSKVAVAPDDFCHVLFLEITSLFECDSKIFSLLAGSTSLDHEDMVSERLTTCTCDVILVWHETDLGTRKQDVSDAATQSSD
jgi:hypothetical protein